jgi:hypothetical protein
VFLLCYSIIDIPSICRESFLAGLPPLDFPGGKGESEHIGRATKEMIEEAGGVEGLRAMGF